MSLTRRLVLASTDPKGRIISIFVGAVLLPSLALSYVSLNFVPRLAQATTQAEQRRAERILYYVEKDLQQAARTRALEAARAVGIERLLEGRPEEVEQAVSAAGFPPEAFESLRLEASSPRKGVPSARRAGDAEDPVQMLSNLETPGAGEAEDAVVWTGGEDQVVGVVRFRLSERYARQRLIREYFERSHQDPGLVIRSADQNGTILYETAPTPDNRFEVSRRMAGPSLRGVTLSLRYRDHSIAQGVRRWELGTLALVVFIDLMLAAGLYLVYSNVRREIRLSRLKSDFVANVSHELKTPLALIRLYAETLELGRIPSEQRKQQYYRVINKESHRLTQLINNILDFSRIEAGRKEYRFAPTDVGEVVHEVVDAYRFPIEQQGFSLQLEVPDDLPLVEADKEALGQALLNLVNNAMKYSPRDKFVRVSVRVDGSSLRIAVADRGIGVAKDEQDKIFEKFYRAEDSLVHETKGSGLGLPLVRHIMEAHGGGVEVESDPGRGSVFTLVLPLEKQA